jgi:hypothetical protein
VLAALAGCGGTTNAVRDGGSDDVPQREAGAGQESGSHGGEARADGGGGAVFSCGMEKCSGAVYCELVIEGDGSVVGVCDPLPPSCYSCQCVPGSNGPPCRCSDGAGVVMVTCSPGQ